MRGPTRKGNDVSRRRTTPADGNVFADLGFAPEKAAELLRDADARIEKVKQLKLAAARQLAGWIKAQHMSQLAAAHVLAVSRPRVSDLVKLEVARFSLDCLAGMLLRVGQDVSLVFGSPAVRGSARGQRRASV